MPAEAGLKLSTKWGGVSRKEGGDGAGGDKPKCEEVMAVASIVSYACEARAKRRRDRQPTGSQVS